MLSPGPTLRIGEVPQLRPLPLRVPDMRGVAEREHALLGARFLLVAPRAAERRIEAVAASACFSASVFMMSV